MIKKILLLGGESSGKSTMAKAIADKFGGIKVDEYGRTFYEERPGKAYEYDDLLQIAKVQIIDELLAMGSSERNGLVVCDTSLIVTYFYSMEWFGKADRFLSTGAIPSLLTYTHVFLCDNDFKFVQDGSRQSIEFSTKQKEFYKFVLESCGITYTWLRGAIAERLNTVSKVLKG